MNMIAGILTVIFVVAVLFGVQVAVAWITGYLKKPRTVLSVFPIGFGDRVLVRAWFRGNITRELKDAEHNRYV
jgi:hypothetical protein